MLRRSLLLWLPAGCAALFAADRFKPFKLKTLEGAPATLQDVKGKATLVGFFFPSCRFCNAAEPEIQKLYDRYKDQGLAVVWINILPEEDKKVAAWRTRTGSTIPVLTGASQASLQRDYKVKMTPTHYLLNAEGEPVFTLAGFHKGDEQKLDDQIRKILGA
jgi:thiol-disulfide isomerase/thioredoxin